MKKSALQKAEMKNGLQVYDEVFRMCGHGLTFCILLFGAMNNHARW